MKIVGFVPSKLNSQRLPRKNVKKLGGVPLVNYALRTMNKAKQVGDVVIFASEPSICRYIEDGLRFRFLKRPGYLDTQKAKVQDFVGEFIARVDADIIVLLHITSPFIKPSTIKECIDKVVSGKYDSAFAAVELRKFCWYKGSPLNYRLDRPIPRTQDIEPVFAEQSGLYIFRAELFKKKQQRVSAKSFVKIVDDIEGHDIDTPEDLRLAEIILSNRIREKCNVKKR